MRQNEEKNSLARRIIDLYVDGFRNMTVGKTLWAVIIVKLIFIFVLLKLFFFPNFLLTNFSDDDERAEYVRGVLSSDDGE
ncbi:MAG: DUF4492 domain-containing protein [Muribaculaceae bacterium]